MSSYIIAGSRTITDYSLVKDYIDSLQLNITEIISGMAHGVDTLGKKYGIENNIQVVEFPAQWQIYGKSAGPRRNTQMAEYVSKKNGGLILIWDGKSKGSGHMKNIAEEYGIKIWEKIYE